MQFEKYLLLILIFFNLLSGQNNFPIVLIHGFMGWGSDEMGDYHYWGGKSDLKEDLENDGYTVIELSVGAVSSNWDRAIEAYYQLKGGQVDYGKGHSNKYGLVQKPKGKKYNGIYPQWDESNPIHIIGHSMGGQTARMLNYLLTHEIYEDEINGIKEESYFLGGIQTNLIRSITSISTPHDGTTLANITVKIIPFIQYFVGVAGLVGSDYFNFDLEQWNFHRLKEETWSSYIKRMRKHPAWNSKNMSAWDLSLDGAKELNDFLQASPDIYYFSIVTSTTKIKDQSNFHNPLPKTPLLTRSRAKLMGSRPGYWNDGTPTDSTWYENDGVVNTTSMYGPSTGSNGSDPITEYDESELLIPGQWYYIKTPNMDHWSVIGHDFNSTDRISRGKTLIIDHVSRLNALPSK